MCDVLGKEEGRGVEVGRYTAKFTLKFSSVIRNKTRIASLLLVIE